MYNGIGLQTARGSGTNGYVQTNKFFVRPKNSKLVDSSKGFGPDQGTAGIARKPNRDILEHDRKRQIELKLTILEDKLSDQGYTDSEIADKLNEARASLEAADAAASGDGANPFFSNEKNVSDTQTHQIAARKEKQLETMRAALGISLPDAKEEKQPGLADMNAHEDDDDDEKPRNYKKGGLEGDGEYEEGEIFHRNEDGEAKLKRHEKDLVSERKLDKKGRRSDRTTKDEEDDYKHIRGHSRKQTDKQSRRAHSFTDSESDSMHSSDSEHDSTLGTKRKQRAQRKSKNSEPSGSDDSAFDSEDSDDARGRRRGHVQKHKKNDQRKTRGRKKEVSESSDFDSDVETRRKHRYEKSKKSKSKISDHSSDGSEEKHRKGRPDKLVKSHKRHDPDDSDLETKTRHEFEKSKKMKSQVNKESDDSDREPERWGSNKFEEGHKRQVEMKPKYRAEKSEKSKLAVIDASDYSSDDSRRGRQRREAHKRYDSDNDSDIKQKSRSEKPSRIKSKLNSDSDSDNNKIEREYKRKAQTSPKVQEVSRHVKRGRHDSEDSDSDGKLKSKRGEAMKVRYDEERKDDRRGRNRDDEYKRKHVEVAENRDYGRQRRDNSKSDDRKKQGRGVHEDDESRGQRRDERKREDENDYKRQKRGDDDGRRQDIDRDSSKRTEYEESGKGDRRHRHDFSEDRWR